MASFPKVGGELRAAEGVTVLGRVDSDLSRTSSGGDTITSLPLSTPQRALPGPHTPVTPSPLSGNARGKNRRSNASSGSEDSSTYRPSPPSSSSGERAGSRLSQVAAGERPVNSPRKRAHKLKSLNPDSPVTGAPKKPISPALMSPHLAHLSPGKGKGKAKKSFWKDATAYEMARLEEQERLGAGNAGSSAAGVSVGQGSGSASPAERTPTRPLPSRPGQRKPASQQPAPQASFLPALVATGAHPDSSVEGAIFMSQPVASLSRGAKSQPATPAHKSALSPEARGAKSQPGTPVPKTKLAFQPRSRPGSGRSRPGSGRRGAALTSPAASAGKLGAARGAEAVAVAELTPTAPTSQRRKSARVFVRTMSRKLSGVGSALLKSLGASPLAKSRKLTPIASGEAGAQPVEPSSSSYRKLAHSDGKLVDDKGKHRMADVRTALFKVKSSESTMDTAGSAGIAAAIAESNSFATSQLQAPPLTVITDRNVLSGDESSENVSVVGSVVDSVVGSLGRRVHYDTDDESESSSMTSLRRPLRGGDSLSRNDERKAQETGSSPLQQVMPANDFKLPKRRSRRYRLMTAVAQKWLREARRSIIIQDLSKTHGRTPVAGMSQLSSIAQQHRRSREASREVSPANSASPSPAVTPRGKALDGLDLELLHLLDSGFKSKKEVELAGGFDSNSGKFTPRSVHMAPVKVTHEYEAQDSSELSLRVGEILTVHHQDERGWWKGTRVSDGVTGWFPSTFVEGMARSPSAMSFPSFAGEHDSAAGSPADALHSGYTINSYGSGHSSRSQPSVTSERSITSTGSEYRKAPQVTWAWRSSAVGSSPWYWDPDICGWVTVAPTLNTSAATDTSNTQSSADSAQGPAPVSSLFVWDAYAYEWHFVFSTDQCGTAELEGMWQCGVALQHSEDGSICKGDPVWVYGEDQPEGMFCVKHALRSEQAATSSSTSAADEFAEYSEWYGALSASSEAQHEYAEYIADDSPPAQHAANVDMEALDAAGEAQASAQQDEGEGEDEGEEAYPSSVYMPIDHIQLIPHEVWAPPAAPGEVQQEDAEDGEHMLQVDAMLPPSSPPKPAESRQVRRLKRKKTAPPLGKASPGNPFSRSGSGIPPKRKWPGTKVKGEGEGEGEGSGSGDASSQPTATAVKRSTRLQRAREKRRMRRAATQQAMGRASSSNPYARGGSRRPPLVVQREQQAAAAAGEGVSGRESGSSEAMLGESTPSPKNKPVAVGSVGKLDDALAPQPKRVPMHAAVARFPFMVRQSTFPGLRSMYTSTLQPVPESPAASGEEDESPRARSRRVSRRNSEGSHSLTSARSSGSLSLSRTSSLADVTVPLASPATSIVTSDQVKAIITSPSMAASTCSAGCAACSAGSSPLARGSVAAEADDEDDDEDDFDEEEGTGTHAQRVAARKNLQIKSDRTPRSSESSAATTDIRQPSESLPSTPTMKTGGAAAAQGGTKSSPGSITSTLSPRRSPRRRIVALGPAILSREESDRRLAASLTIPFTLARCIAPYDAMDPGELSLSEGEVLEVLEHDQVGWFKGRRMRGSSTVAAAAAAEGGDTGSGDAAALTVGWFPASFVEPYSHIVAHDDDAEPIGGSDVSPFRSQPNSGASSPALPDQETMKITRLASSTAILATLPGQNEGVVKHTTKQLRAMLLTRMGSSGRVRAIGEEDEVVDSSDDSSSSDDDDESVDLILGMDDEDVIGRADRSSNSVRVDAAALLSVGESAVEDSREVPERGQVDITSYTQRSSKSGKLSDTASSSKSGLDALIDSLYPAIPSSSPKPRRAESSAEASPQDTMTSRELVDRLLASDRGLADELFNSPNAHAHP